MSNRPEKPTVLEETATVLAEDETVNSWLVNSSIPNCPICKDHWRVDNDGKPCCTANPAHEGCPLS
jgi:hypothetical protein